MSTIYQLLIGNDTVLEIVNLRNDINGVFLDGAVVAVTLLDADALEVAGQVWPQALVYVPGSRGVYRATLAAALPLVANARYVARVSVDGGPALHARWDMECVARVRG